MYIIELKFVASIGIRTFYYCLVDLTNDQISEILGCFTVEDQMQKYMEFVDTTEQLKFKNWLDIYHHCHFEFFTLTHLASEV